MKRHYLLSGLSRPEILALPSLLNWYLSNCINFFHFLLSVTSYRITQCLVFLISDHVCLPVKHADIVSLQQPSILSSQAAVISGKGCPSPDTGKEGSDESFQLQTLIHTCCNTSDSKPPGQWDTSVLEWKQPCWNKDHYTN